MAMRYAIERKTRLYGNQDKDDQFISHWLLLRNGVVAWVDDIADASMFHTAVAGIAIAAHVELTHDSDREEHLHTNTIAFDVRDAGRLK